MSIVNDIYVGYWSWNCERLYIITDSEIWYAVGLCLYLWSVEVLEAYILWFLDKFNCKIGHYDRRISDLHFFKLWEIILGEWWWNLTWRWVVIAVIEYVSFRSVLLVDVEIFAILWFELIDISHYYININIRKRK